MAAGELIQPNDIMFRSWEPKLKNRYIETDIEKIKYLCKTLAEQGFCDK